MEVTISAKNIELTPVLKNHINGKIGRLKKYTDSQMKVEVFLSIEKLRHKIHASVKSKGYRIDSEAEEIGSMYRAIDICVDRLEKQLRRGKHNPNHKKTDKRSIRLETPDEEPFENVEDDV